MPQKRPTNSLYAQWVRGSVALYAASVKPHFTLKEFSSWAQCKITPNLRNRMKQLVYEGVLEVDFAIAGSHGSCHVFTVINQ